MADSVYKVIELIGTSKDSWEKAAKTAVDRASKSLRELRVAEVVQLDMQLDAKGRVEAYRAKIKVSFKFEGADSAFVVPAKAGTHTPCRLVSAVRLMPSAVVNARGYGSPPSRGRQCSQPRQRRHRDIDRAVCFRDHAQRF